MAGSYGSVVERRQLICLVLACKWLDDLRQVAFENLIEFVECQVNAVIGHTRPCG